LKYSIWIAESKAKAVISFMNQSIVQTSSGWKYPHDWNEDEKLNLFQKA